MPEGVKIPVTVTGAPEAAEQIRGVTGSVAELKQAGGQAGALSPSGQAEGVAATADAAQKAAGALANVGGAAGEAAAKTELLNRESRMLAATVLSQLNPELGATFMLLHRIGTGVGGISTILLGMVAAAVGVAGITTAFRELADAAREAAEQTERQAAAVQRLVDAGVAARERGAEQRARIAGAAAAVGLEYATPSIQDEANRLARERGVPLPIGEEAMLAQKLTEAAGRPFDPEKYMAGLVARGARPVGLGGLDTAHALAKIEEVQKAGSERHRERLESYLADVAGHVKGTAPSEREAETWTLDRIMARIGAERPELGPKSIEAIRSLASTATIGVYGDGQYVLPKGGPLSEEVKERLEGKPKVREALKEGGVSIDELWKLATEAVGRTLGEDGLRGTRPQPTTQPAPIQLNMTVNNDNRRITNTQGIWNLEPGAHEQRRAQELGDGQWVGE